MTTSDEIVAIARGFLGVRFAHQGRCGKSGLDCLGLLFAVASRAGITLRGRPALCHDRRDYGSRPDTDFLRAQLAYFLTPVAADGLRAGDVLLLNIRGRAQHLALVADYPGEGEWGMIHAYAVARKVVEHRLDEVWRERIAGVYRLPGARSSS
ncbi:MAG: NlpC/P60 family protein [Alphaproteobacteria bacterium]